MVNTKVTVKAANNQVYVSIHVPSTGHDEDSYSATEVWQNLDYTNFPSFNGTALEWTDILATAQEVKIENMGRVV